ncbi:MAG: hypothetical protein IH607_08240 [Firmicutes bacterium]|nr:hypothetical protein [Bacillota bacterium]
MRFTRYDTAEAFSSDVLDVLKAHEIENNLLYRNIGDGNVMLTVKDSTGKVLLVADRTPPHPLVMYERDLLHDEETIAFFARSLRQNAIDIDFLFAESNLAESFIRHYGKAGGKRFRPAQTLALSVADHAAPPAEMARGRLRLATEDDLYFLPHWFADFTVACGLGDHDLPGSIESARHQVAQRQLYLWEDKVPVSMAASHRKVTGCRIVGYVYTPPQLRGRKYASACVYALTRDLLTDESPQCALYVDCDNPISNRIYERIGYRRIGLYRQYREVKPAP